MAKKCITRREFISNTSVFIYGAFLFILIPSCKTYAIHRYGKEKWNVSVNREKCTGCEECVNACPVGVFEMQEGKAVPLNEDECLGCEDCMKVCPANIISVYYLSHKIDPS